MCVSRFTRGALSLSALSDLLVFFVQKVLMCLNLVTFLSWSWCVAIVTTSNVFTLYRLYFNKTRIDYDRRLVADLDGIEPAYAP